MILPVVAPIILGRIMAILSILFLILKWYMMPAIPIERGSIIAVATINMIKLFFSANQKAGFLISSFV